jgi:hypothetical protein
MRLRELLLGDVAVRHIMLAVVVLAVVILMAASAGA